MSPLALVSTPACGISVSTTDAICGERPQAKQIETSVASALSSFFHLARARVRSSRFESATVRLIATRFLGRRSIWIAPARIRKRVDSTHRAHAEAFANDAKDFPAASNLKTLFVLHAACLLLQLGGVHGRRHAAIHAREKDGTLRTHDTGRLEMRGRVVVFGSALFFDITIGGKSATKLQKRRVTGFTSLNFLPAISVILDSSILSAAAPSMDFARTNATTAALSFASPSVAHSFASASRYSARRSTSHSANGRLAADSPTGAASQVLAPLPTRCPLSSLRRPRTRDVPIDDVILSFHLFIELSFEDILL